MKSMTDIPCKDCITFAICNAQISDDKPFTDVVNKLVPKCSLIEDYTTYHEDYLPSNLVMSIAKFFKPKASYISYGKGYMPLTISTQLKL